jgi:hypothetical protein
MRRHEGALHHLACRLQLRVELRRQRDVAAVAHALVRLGDAHAATRADAVVLAQHVGPQSFGHVSAGAGDLVAQDFDFARALRHVLFFLRERLGELLEVLFVARDGLAHFADALLEVRRALLALFALFSQHFDLARRRVALARVAGNVGAVVGSGDALAELLGLDHRLTAHPLDVCELSLLALEEFSDAADVRAKLFEPAAELFELCIELTKPAVDLRELAQSLQLISHLVTSDLLSFELETHTAARRADTLCVGPPGPEPGTSRL